MSAESSKKIQQLAERYKKEQREVTWRKFKSNKALLFGGIVFSLLAFMAIFGPLLSNVDPYEMKVTDRLVGPSSEHWFGTDEFGRDLFTRMLYGARVSLMVGLAVAAISSVLGLLIGLYASYYKTLDHILMRVCDGLIAIPGILLAIALMAALKPSATNVIIALVVVFTPHIARVVRSSALVIKEQPYIEAMHAQGAGNTRIIMFHILPNVLSPLLVQATFVFAEAIISEAALSFLGAGVPAPEPSWGNILQAGKLVIYKAWWMIVVPGSFIVMAVLSLNLLGDGLRDFLDPRTKNIPTRRRRRLKKQHGGQ
ncbi:ABC transporter permease [Halalkalibacter krulwichiae]|uniref:ABC transporter permease n=1 Tax=Halalkalibacter krulwichiae TaxID=199441 RepID=UPI0008240099|nr:ABC transporter permease [Halalkalibacter krulwichiae]